MLRGILCWVWLVLQDLTSLDGTYDEEGGMGTDDSSSTGARTCSSTQGTFLTPVH
jgi:hypothetical protein